MGGLAEYESGRFRLPKSLQEDYLFSQSNTKSTAVYKDKWTIEIDRNWQAVREQKFPSVDPGSVFKDYDVHRVQSLQEKLNYPTPPGSPPTFRYKKHKFYNLLKLHRMIHGSSGTWPAVVPQLIETCGGETPSRLHLFLRASLRHRLTFLEFSTVLFTVPLTRMTELLRRQIFFCFYHMPFLVFLFSELTKINAY